MNLIAKKTHFVRIYFIIFGFFLLFSENPRDIYSLSYFAIGNLIGVSLLFLRHRHSPFLGPLFLLLSYIFYSIWVGRYFQPERYPINEIIDYSTDFEGLLILFLFSATFSFFNISGTFNLKKTLGDNRASTVLAVSLAFFALSLMYINSTVESDGRGGYTPLYEYSIIFFIFSIYYAFHSGRRLVYFVAFVLLLGVYRDFSLGHRVTGIQLIMVLYVMIFSHYYTYKRGLIGLFSALILGNAVAVYRSDFEFNIFKIIAKTSDVTQSALFASDSAIYAYVASLTFVSMREILNSSQIINYLVDFLIGIFVSGQYGETLYSISREYYAHANGGLLPIYLYFYFGMTAPIFIAVIVISYMKIPEFSRRTLPTFIFIYIFVTMPRWMIYSPSQLFRGVFLLCLSSFLLFMIRGIFVNSIRNRIVSVG